MRYAFAEATPAMKPSITESLSRRAPASALAPIVLVLAGCVTSRELLARGDLGGASAAFAREEKTLAQKADFLERALAHLDLRFGAELGPAVELQALDGGAFVLMTAPGWLVPDAGASGGAVWVAERLRFEQWSPRATDVDGGVIELRSPIVGVLTPRAPKVPDVVSAPKYSALEQWLIGAGFVTGVIPAVGAMLGLNGPERAGAFLGAAFEAATSNERLETEASKRARAFWLDALRIWSEMPTVKRALALEARGLGLASRRDEVSSVRTLVKLSYRGEVTWWHGLRAGFSEPRAAALADSLELLATVDLELPAPAPVPELAWRPLEKLHFRCRDPNPRPYEDLVREREREVEDGQRPSASPDPDVVIRCVATP